MKPCLVPTLTLLLACACAPPPAPPAPPQIILAPAPSASSAPAPPIDTALVSVVAARRPPTLALDGDLAEWGSLLPPPPKPPPPAPVPAPVPDPDHDRPLPSGPNPASASSHLALALTSDGVTLAAELGEPAKDGIWLGIGVVPPTVPSVGLFTRAGQIRPFDCEFETIRLIEGEFERGKRNPPEVVAACRALIARHDELVARHRARFTRLFKLDRDGVRRVAVDGTLSPIEGAKAVFKPGPHGGTVEVALPISALPRMVEAPVVTLRLVARAVTGQKPDLVAAQWVEVELPDPVTFEPFGDLRNHSARRLDSTVRETGFSYQPGDALHVETMRYDTELKADAVITLDETLQHQPVARIGDLEIGYVSVYRPWLAIFDKGKFLREARVPPDENDGGPRPVDTFSSPEPRGFVKRDGEIHLFSYGKMSFAWSGEIRWPSWSVIAIAPDGSVRDPVEATEVPMMVGGETTGFISPDHSSFGVRGPADNAARRPGEPDMVSLEVTWKWNPAKKKYVSKQRRSPLPAPAKEIRSPKRGVK
ncbi:MAG: hypothetical protein ABJE95_09655 [Byssovorax sp.]